MKFRSPENHPIHLSLSNHQHPLETYFPNLKISRFFIRSTYTLEISKPLTLQKHRRIILYLSNLSNFSTKIGHHPFEPTNNKIAHFTDFCPTHSPSSIDMPSNNLHKSHIDKDGTFLASRPTLIERSFSKV